VPNKIDPTMNYRRIGELTQEFTALWERLHAFYLDASSGFLGIKTHVEEEQSRARAFLRGSECDSEEFQDSRAFIYDRILGESFCMAHVQMPKQGIVKKRNSFDGDNFNSLGQLCVTAFYDYWNDYMRREYVIAKGKLDPGEINKAVGEAAMREYACFGVWGDLRQLRQAIVHHRGIATKSTERCELFRWFKRDVAPSSYPAGTGV
jgi:hypothetical protein